MANNLDAIQQSSDQTSKKSDLTNSNLYNDVNFNNFWKAFEGNSSSAANHLPQFEVTQGDLNEAAIRSASSVVNDFQNSGFAAASQDFVSDLSKLAKTDPSQNDQNQFTKDLSAQIVNRLIDSFASGENNSPSAPMTNPGGDTTPPSAPITNPGGDTTPPSAPITNPGGDTTPVSVPVTTPGSDVPPTTPTNVPDVQTNAGSGPLSSSGPDGAWGGQTKIGQMVDGHDIFQGAESFLNHRPTGPVSSARALNGMHFGLQHSAGPNDYNSPIQEADGSNGYQTFKVQHVGGGWGNAESTIKIPIPKGGFKPATGTDGHLDVFDPTTGKYWSVWKMDPKAGTVGSADVGDNIYTSNGFGNTASGLAPALGQIMPGELDTPTSLTHAVGIGLPGNVLNDMFSNETAASHADGYLSQAAGAFSEGGKLALPADFDPAAHGIKLTTAGLAIVNALKNYGGIIEERNEAGSNLIGINSDYKTSPDLGDINAIVPYLQYFGGTQLTKSY